MSKVADDNKLAAQKFEQQLESLKTDLNQLENRNRELANLKIIKMDESNEKSDEYKRNIEKLENNIIELNETHSELIEIKNNKAIEITEQLKTVEQQNVQIEIQMKLSEEQLIQLMVSKQNDDEKFAKTTAEYDEKIDILKYDFNQLNENKTSNDQEFDDKLKELDNIINNLQTELSTANEAAAAAAFQNTPVKKQKAAPISQPMQKPKIINFSQFERKITNTTQSHTENGNVLSLIRMESYQSLASSQKNPDSLHNFKIDEMKIQHMSVNTYKMYRLNSHAKFLCFRF